MHALYALLAGAPRCRGVTRSREERPNVYKLSCGARLAKRAVRAAHLFFICKQMCAARIEDGRSPSSTSVSFNGLFGRVCWSFASPGCDEGRALAWRYLVGVRYISQDMIQCALFDLYGTLIRLRRDSRPFYQVARRSQLNRREAIQIALTEDFGSLRDFALRVQAPLSDVTLVQLESQLREDLETSEVFDDVVPVLRALRDRGLQIGVISNIASPYARPFHRRGLSRLVDLAVFSCDVGSAKPAAVIYELALTKLGCTAESAIMIGDSYRCDVRGASAAGINGLLLCRSDAGQGDIRSLDEVLATELSTGERCRSEVDR